jgi:hypothetical protein
MYDGALYNNDHFMSFALLRGQHAAMVPRCKGLYTRKFFKFTDSVSNWCSGRLNGAVAQCEKSGAVCGLKRKRNAQKRAIIFVFNMARNHPSVYPQAENTLIGFHHANLVEMEWLADMIPQTEQYHIEAKARMASWDPTFAH